MRRHGTVPSPTGSSHSDHLAWCFDGRDDFDAAAVEFLAEGLERGERVIFAVEDPDPGRLTGLGDVGRLLAEERLVLERVPDMYLTAGRFDIDACLARITAFVDATLAAGFSGLRGTADNTALLIADGGPMPWLSYEPFADRVAATAPVVAMCGFDRRRIPTDLLELVCALHPAISPQSPSPGFQVFHDDGATHLIGEVNALSADRFAKVLSYLPPSAELVLDVGGSDFVDHSLLVALHRLSSDGAATSLRNASPLLRRVAELLALDGVRFDGEAALAS